MSVPYHHRQQVLHNEPQNSPACMTSLTQANVSQSPADQGWVPLILIGSSDMSRINVEVEGASNYVVDFDRNSVQTTTAELEETRKHPNRGSWFEHLDKGVDFMSIESETRGVFWRKIVTWWSRGLGRYKQ